MKIGDYSVAMNAQYFKVEFESTEAKISSTDEDFDKESAPSVQKTDEATQTPHNQNNELSRELTQALLGNIQGETKRLIGDRVEISQTYVESQALNYSVNAFIQADGKEIELSLDVSLSRSFVQRTSITVALVPNLTDPLVISLDGGMPSLSSKTFAFDIDSDGTSDQISKLNDGSGFLALDKNGNGKIDDGTELFGTKSGDGFADLKMYDDDNNGWIDENDAIFDKLRIWQGTGEESTLIALGETGIGAIFLGNTKTPFSLKSDTNQLLGEIRSSSFVLYEDGRAGVISQVDLAITKDTKDNLKLFEKNQEQINIANLQSLYSKDDAEKGSQKSGDKRLSEIQGKIKALEGDLRKAKDHDKPAIQAKIGALHAQMMSILDASVA